MLAICFACIILTICGLHESAPLEVYKNSHAMSLLMALNIQSIRANDLCHLRQDSCQNPIQQHDHATFTTSALASPDIQSSDIVLSVYINLVLTFWVEFVQMCNVVGHSQ